MKKSVLVFLVLIMSGCTIWSQVKPGSEAVSKNGFSVNLPSGWMRFHPGVDGFMVTKDGLSIQRITVVKYSLQKAFRKTKKALTPDMLITDLMDYYIAEFRQQNEGATIEVESKEPAVLGGKEGFKVSALLIAPDGLRYRLHAYGSVDANGFYEVSYQAPVIHYFERDLSAFEKVKKSFQISQG